MSNLPNPYAAPTTTPDQTYLGPENFVRATQGLRLANFFIDQIIIRVLGFALGVMIVVVSPNHDIGQIEALLIGICLALAYFVGMEAACGRTVGKLLTGTKVVDQNGRPPTFNQVVIRSLSRLIPFEPFSFLGKNTYGWHDSFSKTYVVKA